MHAHSLRLGFLPLAVFALVATVNLVATAARGHCQEVKPKPAEPDAEYIRKLIPEKIVGEYQGGRLRELEVAGRQGYVVEPTGAVDPQRRWIWIFPFWLGINDGHGALHHRWYVEQYLAKGFHVAGINVGTSCGSPKGAAICQKFHEQVRKRFDLNPRARLLVQSNGGLIGYGWAFRHPEFVERIGGICPATDFRTWPGLFNVTSFPEKGLDYGLSLAELTERVAEFNPIDHLEPLARERVKLLHIHGDKDELVPMQENSTELARRYTELGGSAKVVVIEGLGHGGKVLYESQPLLEFLLEDCEAMGFESGVTGDAYLVRVEVWGYEEAVDEGVEPPSELLRSIELLVETDRPFFGRSKSKGTTLEIRGQVTAAKDPAKFQLSIESSLKQRDTMPRDDDDELVPVDDATSTKTTVVVTPGESIVLGGMETRRSRQGKGKTQSKTHIKGMLTRPCVGGTRFEKQKPR